MSTLKSARPAAASQKAKLNVYTMMLVVSFFAIVTGCVLLYMELQSFANPPDKNQWWWDTTEAKIPPEAAPAPAGVPAVAPVAPAPAGPATPAAPAGPAVPAGPAGPAAPAVPAAPAGGPAAPAAPAGGPAAPAAPAGGPAAK